jgi:hypothetical protein
MRLITETLRSIQHLPIERLHLFTKKGALVFVKDGDSNEVPFTEYEFALLKGKILVHNHPQCNGQYCTLSETDRQAITVHKAHKIISICSCGNIDSYEM